MGMERGLETASGPVPEPANAMREGERAVEMEYGFPGGENRTSPRNTRLPGLVQEE